MTELQRIARLIPGYDPFATAPEGWWFDEKAAQEVIDFIQSNCRHVVEFEGLIKLEDWQKAFFANLFGWKRPDGTRRYRETLLMVPRKNSKTTMAAMAILFVLYCDGVRGSQIYTAASEAEQSRICFSIVRGMIEEDPDLIKHAELYLRHLFVGGACYRSLNSAAGSKHGYSAHVVHIDELHAHKTSDLVDALTMSQGSRTKPLIIHTTTSDFQRPDSPCNKKHDYASKVRDGIIDDAAFLPVIYEATLEDDWTDEKLWRRTNPNLEVSITLEYLRRAFKQAQAEPSEENKFKRWYLNIRTEQETRLIPMDAWDKCGGTLPDLTGRECWGGLDMASRIDITALVLAFPEDGGYILKAFFWIPGDTARNRQQADNVPYLQWIREGHIIETNGNRCDYEKVRHDINQLAKLYDMRQLAVDRWNASQLIGQLQDEDGWGDRIIEHGQGYKDMSDPTKELEAIVASLKIQHGGNPVLRWMASNVVGKMDPAGNLKFDKSKSGEKIDGMVAAAMAIGRAAVRTDTRSVYQTRGLISV